MLWYQLAVLSLTENPCVHFVECGLSFSPSDLSSSPHPIAPAMLSSWLFLCTSGLLLSRAFVWVVPSAQITLLSHPEGLYASPDHPAEGATCPLSRCAVLFLPGFFFAFATISLLSHPCAALFLFIRIWVPWRQAFISVLLAVLFLVPRTEPGT